MACAGAGDPGDALQWLTLVLCYSAPGSTHPCVLTQGPESPGAIRTYQRLLSEVLPLYPEAVQAQVNAFLRLAGPRLQAAASAAGATPADDDWTEAGDGGLETTTGEAGAEGGDGDAVEAAVQALKNGVADMRTWLKTE